MAVEKIVPGLEQILFDTLRLDRQTGLDTILLDPVRLDQQINYKENGLTVTSNNVNIMPRDAAGNIIFHESSSENPLLIIEPVDTRIMLRSVLKILDTRFEYFKFPVTVTQDTNVLNLDTELSIDVISTELRLPVGRDSKNQPVPWDKISTRDNDNWYYDNSPTSGFKELPFIGGENQTTANAYTLTKSVIDELKRQNKTLKFTIQTQFIAERNNQGEVSIRLNRDNIKSYRPWTFPQPEITTPVNDINYPVLIMTFVLNSNDLVEGDIFTILAVASGDTHVYSLNDKAYWKIESIDIPKTPPIYGINPQSGVYSVEGNNVELSINDENGNKLIGIYQNGKFRHYQPGFVKNITTPVTPDIVITTPFREAPSPYFTPNNAVTTPTTTPVTQPYPPIGYAGLNNGDIKSAPSGQPHIWNNDLQKWTAL